ncbi:nuclear transport factor 2 family protein [Streptomyces sp. NPDC050560]|uniref:nuclear transport factor 2 family protein n=1 Tax=Streptomyces sp. NPDC050560 TaxID=3365630 RepID=UPI0037BD3AF8
MNVSIDNGFVERYIAAWNEPDPQRRSKAVAEVWHEDGRYANTGRVFKGRAEIEEAVTEAFDDFVAKGFAFKLNAYAGHHDAGRITWDMVPRDGGDVVARGTEYLILAEDGRVISDHQFPEEI